MNVDARLNWVLWNWIPIVVVALSIGVNSMVVYLRWLPKTDQSQSKTQSQRKNQPSCLKVSDFFSVHLTTYFLSATGDGVMDPNDNAKRYDQYCDRIPGTGRVIFTVDLMEQDTRDVSVALSLSQYDSGGQLTLMQELPPNLHPHGVLTLNAAIVERGKYLLKVAFGKAKSKDDIIEMPILVGQ